MSLVRKLVLAFLLALFAAGLHYRTLHGAVDASPVACALP